MGRLHSLLLSGVLSAAVAVADELPQFGVLISPIFDNDAIAFLNMTMQIADPKSKANSSLLLMDVNTQLTPEQRYDGNALTATDELGDLPISYHDVQETKRNWVAHRDPVGGITVSLTAEPRGNTTGLSGRNDLRKDQGGFFGQGSTFIPLPPSKEQWNMTVTWDVPESAPEGTRYTSAFGDARQSSETGQPDQVIAQAYFAAGPLQRWPAWDSIDPENEGDATFGVYWIGDLPWDSDDLANATQNIYRGTANYFSDHTSDYRVFFRRDWQETGGQGGFRSFILEYKQGAELQNPASAIENLLSHEIIHGFAQTYPDDDYDKWYSEGIAEYLAACGPFFGGTLDKKTFTQWLNDNAQDYYTASPLNHTWSSVITKYWTQGTAVVKAPYTRGFIYLAYLQGLIVSETNGEHTFDDVILPLYQDYLDGLKVQTPEILTKVATLVGHAATNASFNAMTSGQLLVPHEDSFANAGLKLVRKDLQKFEIGMSENSFGNNKVIDLVPGSRAEKAGARNGDEIVDAFDVWGSTDTYESKLRIVVNRDGQQTPIEWWPRSDQKVEAYQWVDASE